MMLGHMPFATALAPDRSQHDLVVTGTSMHGLQHYADSTCEKFAHKHAPHAHGLDLHWVPCMQMMIRMFPLPMVPCMANRGNE